MSSFPQGLLLREPTSDDLGFVMKAWIRSYANSPYAGAMTRSRQVAAIRGTVLDLLQRGAVVRILCLASRPEFILGFVCYEQLPDFPVVHYVYVRFGYRQSGLGSALVESVRNGKDVQVRSSHRTPLGDYLFKERHFSPKFARYGAPDRQRPAERNAHD
jgi:hypothetical protein